MGFAKLINGMVLAERDKLERTQNELIKGAFRPPCGRGKAVLITANEAVAVHVNVHILISVA